LTIVGLAPMTPATLVPCQVLLDVAVREVGVAEVCRGDPTGSEASASRPLPSFAILAPETKS
jgi:hypothetical protein